MGLGRANDPKRGVIFTGNCPIRERTADGISVGRCWYHLPDKKTCPRHGDVSAAVEHYKETGELTDEQDR